MSWILRGLILIMVFSSGASYLMYKVYKTTIFFVIVPLLSMIPVLFMYLGRKYGKVSLDVFTGHYLFYLNYILLGAFIILFLGGFFKFFSISLLDTLSENKNWFQIICLLLIFLLAFNGSKNFQRVYLHHHDIQVSKLNQIGDLKFGFISDVHLNGKFNGNKLRETFSKMKENGIELILIGGDFIDNSHRTIKDDIKSIIDEYPFKHGIYLALGNHEYYGGIEENIDYIRNLGINILRDETVEVEGVTIVGRDDRHNRNRKPLNELLENIDQEKPVIVIDHNPISTKELKGKKVDLYLSGHTHNGQLVPFNFIVDYMYDNPKGYKRIFDTDTFVSSGLGTWMIPYRIGSQSEALIFNMKFERKF